MFDIILFYVAFAVLGLGVIKNKKLGVAISFVAFILASVDFLCLEIMGQHIDYTTLTRIDGTMLAMAPQVTPTYFYGINLEHIKIGCNLLNLVGRQHSLIFLV